MVAMNPPLVLTVNSGSSSVKLATYRGEELVLSEKTDDRDAAYAWLAANGRLAGIEAVGYRIVHGGPKYSEPVPIDDEVLSELRRIVALAPDHLPDQIEVIDKVGKLLPGVPAVACFDTAFHRTMPRYAQLFGLPHELIDDGMVRYGFHGLSYSYIVDELRKEGQLPERLIVAHLGNGASMAAIRDGKSIDTSMGLTPSGGFIMSNRSGDLDPGVILWMLREKKMSVDEVADVVNQGGGLKGLSGISGDMRTLEKESPRTVYVFCYQVKKFLGAYMAALGGLDMLVFTGGIGENSVMVREWICSDMERFGIKLEAGRSVGDVKVRVMKTNEELVIARATAKVLAG
jgi:acetate kinase